MQQLFSTRNYSVRDFEEWNDRNELVLAPKFQRRDVWNPKAKSYLMDTIIRGKPIPKLYMRQTVVPKGRRTTREIVDGQQRLRAVLSFVKDGFKLSRAHNKEFGGAGLQRVGQRHLGQFLRPPEAHERPSGRQFEIAPLIDRQNNLREGGSRQVLPLAGQLLDQLFEPRIVPDDHHGLGVFPHRLQQRDDVGRASHVKMPVQQDFSRIASRIGDCLSGQLRPHGIGGDNNIGYQSVLPHQLSHPRPIPPAALIQRSLMVIKRRIVPTRLRVPENQEVLHPSENLTRSTLSTSMWLPP